MGDPNRWLGTASDSDELERELLRSLRDVSPHAGAKGEAWDRIAVQAAALVVVGAATSAAHATLAASTATVAEAAGASGATALGVHAPTAAVGIAAKILTAKAVLGITLAGSTMAGAGWWVSHRISETPSITAPSQTIAVPPPPAPAEVPAPPLVGAVPCDSALSSAPCPPPPQHKAPDRSVRPADEPRSRNLLGLESSMLTEARAQLRGGDARAALSTLDRLRTRFPKGVLMQERDVLTIQVLSALGDVSAAKRKAREFLDAHPSSPHAPQLRRLVGDP